RITEQHAGSLHLADAPKRNGKIQGASVRMDIPIRDSEEARADADARSSKGAQEVKAPEAAE
ncbi:MAG: hypothetical protein WBE08_14550, partial [Methyloceanibacter sp.]